MTGTQSKIAEVKALVSQYITINGIGAFAKYLNDVYPTINGYVDSRNQFLEHETNFDPEFIRLLVYLGKTVTLNSVYGSYIKYWFRTIVNCYDKVYQVFLGIKDYAPPGQTRIEIVLFQKDGSLLPFPTVREPLKAYFTELGVESFEIIYNLSAGSSWFYDTLAEWFIPENTSVDGYQIIDCLGNDSGFKNRVKLRNTLLTNFNLVNIHPSVQSENQSSQEVKALIVSENYFPYDLVENMEYLFRYCINGRKYHPISHFTSDIYMFKAKFQIGTNYYLGLITVISDPCWRKIRMKLFSDVKPEQDIEMIDNLIPNNVSAIQETPCNTPTTEQMSQKGQEVQMGQEVTLAQMSLNDSTTEQMEQEAQISQEVTSESTMDQINTYLENLPYEPVKEELTTDILTDKMFNFFNYYGVRLSRDQIFIEAKNKNIDEELASYRRISIDEIPTE